MNLIWSERNRSREMLPTQAVVHHRYELQRRKLSAGTENFSAYGMCFQFFINGLSFRLSMIQPLSYTRRKASMRNKSQSTVILSVIFDYLNPSLLFPPSTLSFLVRLSQLNSLPPFPPCGSLKYSPNVIFSPFLPP